MNGVRKVTPPDEEPSQELKIIVFSPFVSLHQRSIGFSLLDDSKGLVLVHVAPDFKPVEFLCTHFPTVDLRLLLSAIITE